MMTKKLFIFLLALLSFSSSYNNAGILSTAQKQLSSIPKYLRFPRLFLGTAILGTYYWLRKPDKKLPSYESLKAVSFVKVGSTQEQDTPKNTVVRLLKNKSINCNLVINGIKYSVQHGLQNALSTSSQPITVYSPGIWNHFKPYAYNGYIQIKSGFVPDSLVCFNYVTDARRAFNFCQQQDIHALKTICSKVINANPQADLILHGASKGATTILRFLAESSHDSESAKIIDHVSVVVAESPAISVEKALKHWIPERLTRLLARFLLPNYNYKGKTIMDTTGFPNIPILIASLAYDTISDLDDVETMIKKLNSQCSACIKSFVSKNEELKHGSIGKDEAYQKHHKEFLKEHLPHLGLKSRL